MPSSEPISPPRIDSAGDRLSHPLGAMEQKLAVTACTLSNALGHGLDASRRALREGRGGLRRCDFADTDLRTWIGRVDGLDEVVLPASLADFDCRNHRLAWLALNQDGFPAEVERLVARHGRERIGVFLGTSTSGIRHTEIAYAQREADGRLPADFQFQLTHNNFALAEFTRRALDLRGPAQVISTACSSSAKVFAAAWRHIQSGLCDAALVGGVDSLCLTTLYGFNSLELISPDRCRPWDARRGGINIGEAAGFALLERVPPGFDGPCLLGYGESSDAHHMSTPHPEGIGAAEAMRAALRRADLSQVDYVNLHGTGTRSNDASEDRAMRSVFGTRTPCSSTKGWTGHTLGAAGISEAIFSLLALQDGFMPATLNLEQADPQLGAAILREPREASLRAVMSNSFGFGGSNCSLIFGRTD